MSVIIFLIVTVIICSLIIKLSSVLGELEKVTAERNEYKQLYEEQLNDLQD